MRNGEVDVATTAEEESPEEAADDTAETTEETAEESAELELFQTGDTVVILESFHNDYFRGLKGTIEGPPTKGGSSDLLWPVKIDVEPYRIKLAAKYLALADKAQSGEAQQPSASASQGARADGGKKSFLSRLFSRR